VRSALYFSETTDRLQHLFSISICQANFMISGLNARPAQSSCLTSTFLNAGGVGTPQHQLSVA